jgi:hypothetical protein
VLLFITLALSFGWQRWQARQSKEVTRPVWLGLLTASLVALAVVIVWLWRNLGVFGVFIPTASTKVLFMRDYNELFSYNLPLDLNYYLNQSMPAPTWGIGSVISSKFTASWLDLIIIAVQGLFLLGPLFLLGLFALKRRIVKGSYLPFSIYAGLLYIIMVLIFTLAGEHGTLFHSGGGLLPFQAGAAVASIDVFVEWYARRRKRIKAKQLRIIILGLCLAINIFVTLYVGYTELRNWDDDYLYGQLVGRWFIQNKLDTNVIIVGEPLSYTYATGQLAIPLASDGVEANVEAAHKFRATYLALGPVHYDALNQLYLQKNGSGLQWLTTLADGTEIFKIIN